MNKVGQNFILFLEKINEIQYDKKQKKIQDTNK